MRDPNSEYRHMNDDSVCDHASIMDFATMKRQIMLICGHRLLVYAVSGSGSGKAVVDVTASGPADSGSCRRESR